MSTKSAKYFVKHRIEGKTKSVAAKEAGISDVRNVTNIEKTDTYQKLDAKYADYLAERIGMGEVAEEHIKNIKQDQDKGAKNNAIKMFLERVEPEVLQKEDDEKMIIVLRA